jgi:hypothetical protein
MRGCRQQVVVLGCNGVSAALILLVLVELAPHAKYARAQPAAVGIHCAIGTGSCGNWLELGGYKTSCTLLLVRIDPLSTAHDDARGKKLCVMLGFVSVLYVAAGSQCGGEPKFIAQPIPGVPNPEWCGAKFIGFEKGGNWKTLKPVWR